MSATVARVAAIALALAVAARTADADPEATSGAAFRSSPAALAMALAGADRQRAAAEIPGRQLRQPPSPFTRVTCAVAEFEPAPYEPWRWARPPRSAETAEDARRAWPWAVAAGVILLGLTAVAADRVVHD